MSSKRPAFMRPEDPDYISVYPYEVYLRKRPGQPSLLEVLKRNPPKLKAPKVRTIKSAENIFTSVLETKATPGKVPSAADLRGMVDSFDWQGWREEVDPVIRDSFEAILVASGKKRSREVGVTFDETDPFLQHRLTEYVGTRIVELEGTTKDRVIDLIRNAFANGEGMTLPELGTEIGEAVRETVDGYADWGADRIARSETAIAYNTGDLLAWMQMGVTEVEVQDGTENDEACRQANGQVWTIEYALDNPIEHPNCERSFTPVLDSIQQAGVRMLVQAWMERKAAELEDLMDSEDIEFKAGPEDEARDDHGKWSAGGSAEPTLYDRVQSHLAEHPSNVVRIQTMTRATDFKPKHAAMFKPGKTGESGIYFQAGRQWLYALPENVKFGRPKK